MFSGSEAGWETGKSENPREGSRGLRRLVISGLNLSVARHFALLRTWTCHYFSIAIFHTVNAPQESQIIMTTSTTTTINIKEWGWCFSLINRTIVIIPETFEASLVFHSSLSLDGKEGIVVKNTRGKSWPNSSKHIVFSLKKNSKKIYENRSNFIISFENDFFFFYCCWLVVNKISKIHVALEIDVLFGVGIACIVISRIQWGIVGENPQTTCHMYMLM